MISSQKFWPLDHETDQTNIAILSPKTEDGTDIKDRTMNTLIQNDSRIDYCASSVHNEGNSGELIYPIDFLISRSTPVFTTANSKPVNKHYCHIHF
jgi:hypothetical protein